MKRLWIAILFAGACGGGVAEESHPTPLKYNFDDTTLVSLSPDQQPDVLAAKSDFDKSKMMQAKTKNDLETLRIQLHQAQNEAKAAALVLDSAKEEKSAAGKTADMTRQDNAAKTFNTANLGRQAADAKVAYFKALFAAQEKSLLDNEYDVTVEEARWNLEKAKIAQANNIRPSGFDEQNFEKQYADRVTRETKVKDSANKLAAAAEQLHQSWQKLQEQADGAKGAQDATPSVVVAPPPPPPPPASQPAASN